MAFNLNEVVATMRYSVMGSEPAAIVVRAENYEAAGQAAIHEAKKHYELDDEGDCGFTAVVSVRRDHLLQILKEMEYEPETAAP